MLNLINKLATAMRGGTREVLENAVDANALRILAQEIHDCEAAVRQAKQGLTQVVAQKIRLQRQLDTQQTKQQALEGQIQAALDSQDKKAARSLAEQLAEQENWQAELQQQHQQLAETEQQLSQNLQQARFKLEQYRNQLQMARVNQHTWQAGNAVHSVASCPDQAAARFNAAEETLERIKRKQQDFADQMQAAAEVAATLNGNSAPAVQRKQQAEKILARFTNA